MIFVLGILFGEHNQLSCNMGNVGCKLFSNLNAKLRVSRCINEYTLVFDCDPIISWELGSGKHTI